MNRLPSYSQDRSDRIIAGRFGPVEMALGKIEMKNGFVYPVIGRTYAFQFGKNRR